MIFNRGLSLLPRVQSFNNPDLYIIRDKTKVTAMPPSRTHCRSIFRTKMATRQTIIATAETLTCFSIHKPASAPKIAGTTLLKAGANTEEFRTGVSGAIKTMPSAMTIVVVILETATATTETALAFSDPASIPAILIAERAQGIFWF